MVRSLVGTCGLMNLGTGSERPLTVPRQAGRLYPLQWGFPRCNSLYVEEDIQYRRIFV